MARVKRGCTKHQRHKKYLERGKGSLGRTNRCYRNSRRLWERGMHYQFKSRKDKKGVWRSAFIAVINTACRKLNDKYSKFISMFNKHELSKTMDRKSLALLAQHSFDDFKVVYDTVVSK